MDAVGSVLSIMSCLCTNNPLHEPLARRCKHLGRPTRKLNKLKSLMEELDARKGDLNIKLEKLWLDKGMEPKETVKLWIKNVDHIKSEVSSLVDESEQPRQSLGSCYFCSRIHLGERTERMIKDTLDLLEKGQFSDDSVAETLPKRGYSLPTTTFLEYGTNRRSLMRIWDLLLDHNVRRIGVYGMGGVGKTTLMIEINNHLLKECHFDSVIWVTVSKDSSLEKLQGDIALKLGLEFSTIDDEICKAAKLFEALNRRKRLLLILDDLWEPLSLERVGVPIPTAENGCKLVITTRLLKTCRGMETNEDVEVRVLLEEEAWNLFRAKIGDQVLTSSVIEPIAKDVAKECGGLPLAIVTVGRALRNAFNILEWENALVELRASTDNIDNMDKVVFSRLLLSYKKLRDDTSRLCFLFCALYPEGHLIDTTELSAYWMWEGLLGGVVRTSESKRKVKIILNELKYACLLESADHDGVEYVKLHDLIVDMTIKIIRTSPRCIVNAGSQLTKPPGPDEWGDDVQRLSLMRNDFKFIKFSPMCSKLTSLLLQYNSFVDGIGNGFFDNMQGLKVLDLSYTGISALPESVSNLENLCALLLSHCYYLSALPTLAKLSELMVLDLSSCGLLQELPHGMEHLNNLRHLDISSTGIEFLPFGLVSKFTLLEDLITDCSGVIWVSQRVKGIEGGA